MNLGILLWAYSLALSPLSPVSSSATSHAGAPGQKLKSDSPQKSNPAKLAPLFQPSAPRHFLGFRPHHPPAGQDQELKTLRLKALPDGSFLYRGTKKERFQARIFPDGGVDFFDDASFSVDAKNICIAFYCPVAQNPNFLKSRKKQAEDRARRRKIRKFNKIAGRVLLGALTGSTGFAPVPGQDPKQIHNPIANGHAFEARRPHLVYGAATASGNFGYLPAPKPAQIAFLKRSFEFRLKLAVDHRIRHLEKALSRLQIELGLIEKSTGQALSGRQAKLLALWQEFDAQHHDQTIQDAIVKKLHRTMGVKLRFAREQMTAFARRVFPQSSSTRLPAQLLQAFNQGRVGEAVFQPYESANY